MFTGKCLFKSWYLNSHPQRAIFKAARLLQARRCHQREDVDSVWKVLTVTSQHVPAPIHGVGVPGQGMCMVTTNMSSGLSAPLTLAPAEE